MNNPYPPQKGISVTHVILWQLGSSRAQNCLISMNVGYFPSGNRYIVVVYSHGAKVRGGLKWKKVLQIAMVAPTRTYWWQWHVHGRWNEKQGQCKGICEWSRILLQRVISGPQYLIGDQTKRDLEIVKYHKFIIS